MADKVYANGIWGNPPRDGAVDFVIGSLSIIPERFIEWLQQQTPNDKGYVRLDVLKRKSGDGWSFPLNDWKPDGQSKQAAATIDSSFIDDAAAHVDEATDVPF
jgi:hypothetical protein